MTTVIAFQQKPVSIDSNTSIDQADTFVKMVKNESEVTNEETALIDAEKLTVVTENYRDSEVANPIETEKA